MKIVNIFLAGSTRMEAERNLVRTLANKIQADQCGKGRDIAINITTFENFNAAITATKAQELYDAYINSDADYAMFIFDNEVGGISKHEFDIAFNAFKSKHRPKLYVYFKEACSYCKEYDEIRQLLIATNNYFLVYKDFSHLSMMINNHLLEIIDHILEEIIINTSKKTYRLTLSTNRECTIYENDCKLIDIQPNAPYVIELSKGAHYMSFKDKETSKIIHKKILVFENRKNTFEVRFAQESENSTTEQVGKYSSIWYYILAIMIIITSSLIIGNFQGEPEEDGFDPIENKSEDKGGEDYQDALKEIEKGNLELAADKLQTVINNEPEFADPYIHLANIYINQHHYEDAKALLDTALRLNPGSNWARQLKESIPL